MVTPELQKYVAEQRAAGIPDAQLREVVLASGWPAEAVDEVFSSQSHQEKLKRKVPVSELTIRPKRLLLLVVGIVVVLMIISSLAVVIWLKQQRLF